MNDTKDSKTISMYREFAEDLLENLYHLQAEWLHKEESRYRKDAKEYGSLCDDIRELQALLGEDTDMDVPWLGGEDEEDFDHYDIMMERRASQIEERWIEKSEEQNYYRDGDMGSLAHRWKCARIFFKEMVDWLCSPLGSEDDYHHRWWMGTWANEVFPEWWQIWPRKCPDCGRRWRKCPNNGDDCVPF